MKYILLLSFLFIGCGGSEINNQSNETPLPKNDCVTAGSAKISHYFKTNCQIQITQ